MLRRKLTEQEAGWEPHFRWRGGDVSRIENLADAVFGFSMTLLVVSTTVPRTYAEMRDAFWQVPAFAACFAILIWVWSCHYKFFRRYGLEDVGTVFLNALLLFVVLLYVFPLKFLASFLLRMLRGESPRVMQDTASGEPVFRSGAETVQLLQVYSCGFVLVFLLLAMLYVHAWRRRDRLQLNALEQLATRGERDAHLLSAGVGALSLGISFGGPQGAFWSGMIYPVLGPLHWWHGVRVQRRMAALIASDGPAAPGADTADASDSRDG